MRKCTGCTFLHCPYEAFLHLCPCAICIVKVTCNTVCNPFLEFRRFLINEDMIESYNVYDARSR